MQALKNIVRKTAYGFFSSEPVLSYFRRSQLSGKAVVLMYHEIAQDDADIDAWTVVRLGEFKRQMEYLKGHFDIISLTEALARGKNGSRAQGSRPEAVITFDDGYSGNMLLLPIVEQMKIPMTVFVATKAVLEGIPYWYDRIINAMNGMVAADLDLGHLSLGTYSINRSRGADNWRETERLLRDLKALSPAQRGDTVERILRGPNFSNAAGGPLKHLRVSETRELARSPLMTIGAHSHCHNLLTQLSLEAAAESVMTSRRLLEEWTGKAVTTFAYPNGSFDANTISAVKKCGLECALTTVAEPWDKSCDPYAIPRIGIGRYDSLDLFKLKVSAGLNYLKARF